MSSGQVEFTRKNMIQKKKDRLEKVSLALLQGMVGYELWANAHDEELVDQSIALAREFIRQMDEAAIE